jgi:hypothetical protein
VCSDTVDLPVLARRRHPVLYDSHAELLTGSFVESGYAGIDRVQYQRCMSVYYILSTGRSVNREVIAIMIRAKPNTNTTHYPTRIASTNSRFIPSHLSLNINSYHGSGKQAAYCLTMMHLGTWHASHRSPAYPLQTPSSRSASQELCTLLYDVCTKTWKELKDMLLVNVNNRLIKVTSVFQVNTYRKAVCVLSTSICIFYSNALFLSPRIGDIISSA